MKKKPTAASVAERLLILKYQVVCSLATPPPRLLASLQADERAELLRRSRDLAERTCGALQAAGLWSKLSPAEEEFFRTPGPELDPQAHLHALWRAEAAACLLWALDLLPALPPYDKQADPNVLRPVAADGVREFIRGAALRPGEEIERVRSVAELWHWRSRTRQLQEEGVKPPAGSRFASLDDVVRLAAARSAQVGDIASAKDGDFPAFGKAYRDLDAQEWALARSIAMERHFAFNWLCGYAPDNRWEETPTDT